MSITLNKKQWLLAGLFTFTVVFLCLAFLYIKRTHTHDIEQINTHAAIVAEDVWQLNETGTKTYLQLAVQTGYYKILAVALTESDIFLQVHSQQIEGIDRLLLQLNLIQTKELSANIIYNGQKIGVLRGEKYVRTIYPLFNLFIFQLFIVLTAVFILHLFYNRKLLEQQVLERTKEFYASEGRFHELVNLLPEMVLETDEKGTVTYANEIALERFGISDLRTTDCTLYDLVGHDQNDMDKISFMQWVQEHSHEQTEYTARGADGATFPVLIRSAPILANNQTTGVRLVLVDITERCALEEQLHRARKMKTIGMMAGGVAHDLNNILSGVVNYPELILMKLPEDSNVRKEIESIKASGLRAAEVVADLLTVARGVAASKQTANLNELVQEYLGSPEFLRLQSIYPDLSCKIHLDPEVCNINCSLIHVRKCLMNLITNAAEAMQGKGQVTISTSGQSIDTAGSPYASMKQGRYTVLTIHDRGPGISPKDIEHIFEPFYTKKKMGRSGTGLGLAVVWNTMEDHNGAVKVKSGRKGTSFDLYFPCSSQEKKVVTPITDWRDYAGKGETILVIDDETHQQDIAAQLLESMGYSVQVASSGEEAIAYLDNHSIDLLVLDMIMEPGINGRQTYEKIIQKHPGQCAVIVTGFSESDDVRTTLQLGAGGIINKPYTKEQLGQAVYSVLNTE